MIIPTTTVPRNFNPEEKTKLQTLINSSVEVLEEIDDLRAGLSETVKAVAEELEIKTAVLNKAIKIAQKNNFGEFEDENALIDTILTSVGKK